MARERKKTWFGRLCDKEDNSTALSSVIIIFVVLICLILLIVPPFALGLEAWYNHTVASDISGWAAYIGAITSLLATVCGLKWGINYTDRKFPTQNDPFCDNMMPPGPGRFGASQEDGETEEMIVEENQEV